MLHQVIRPASSPGSSSSLVSCHPESSIGPVLVIDDDHDDRRKLVDVLSELGCTMRTADHSADLPGMIRHGRWSLVIIGIEQLSVDGFEPLREIRSQSFVPILIASNSLCSIKRIIAYELGADGFVARSADPHEVWAQVRAIMRRQEIGSRMPQHATERGGYRFAGWELSRAERILRSPSGRQVSLTRSSYALLVAFLEAPGRILSREHLLRATRAHEDIFDRSVDIQVLRLRERLSRGDLKQHFIRTERGLGYVFDAEVTRLY